MLGGTIGAIASSTCFAPQCSCAVAMTERARRPHHRPREELDRSHLRVRAREFRETNRARARSRRRRARLETLHEWSGPFRVSWRRSDRADRRPRLQRALLSRGRAIRLADRTPEPQHNREAPLECARVQPAREPKPRRSPQLFRTWVTWRMGIAHTMSVAGHVR